MVISYFLSFSFARALRLSLFSSSFFHVVVCASVRARVCVLVFGLFGVRRPSCVALAEKSLKSGLRAQPAARSAL